MSCAVVQFFLEFPFFKDTNSCLTSGKTHWKQLILVILKCLILTVIVYDNLREQYRLSNRYVDDHRWLIPFRPPLSWYLLVKRDRDDIFHLIYIILHDETYFTMRNMYAFVTHLNIRTFTYIQQKKKWERSYLKFFVIMPAFNHATSLCILIYFCRTN